MVVDDDLIEWLKLVKFWREPIRIRTEWIGNLLPLDIEFDAKDHIQRFLGNDCIVLFRRVLALQPQEAGIPIETLGLKKAELDQIIQDGDCACAILLRLGLIIIKKTRSSAYLKPTRLAQDPRIGKLTGVVV